MEEHLLHKAIHLADAIIYQLDEDDLGKPTPCSDWNVRDLTNHIVNETAWVTPLCEGKTVEEVGNGLDGDLLGDDVYGAWRRHASNALQSASVVSGSSPVHLSYGDKAAGGYLDEVGADLVVHAWDLARAIDAECVIDERTATEAMRAAEEIVPMARRSGLVAAEISVPAGASGQEKLLAYYGRDVHWGG